MNLVKSWYFTKYILVNWRVLTPRGSLDPDYFRNTEEVKEFMELRGIFRSFGIIDNSAKGNKKFKELASQNGSRSM